MMQCWQQCDLDLQKWTERIQASGHLSTHHTVWQECEHFPGFDPNGTSCALPVRQVLQELVNHSQGTALEWLNQNRLRLENITDHPLSMSGVIAAAFHDLAMSADQAEMLFLLMRLPGAAAHALEQKQLGWRKYPFFADALKVLDDPKEEA